MSSEIEKVKMSQKDFDELYEIDETPGSPKEISAKEEPSVSEEQFLSEEEMEHDRIFHQDLEQEPSEGTDK